MDENIEKEGLDEEVLDFVEMEAYSPHDNIGAAYNALNAVEGLDDAIMTEQDKRRVRQIRRWSLKIIHQSLKDIHEIIFENDEE